MMKRSALSLLLFPQKDKKPDILEICFTPGENKMFAKAPDG